MKKLAMTLALVMTIAVICSFSVCINPVSAEQITGDQVWNALLNDPQFLNEVPENQRQAYEPYVKKLPQILKDLLDKQFTLETILQAKLAFLKYALEQGIVQELIKAVPQEQIDLMGGRDAVISLLEPTFTQLIKGVEKLLEAMPAALEEAKKKGVTEEQIILSPSTGLGLNPENTEKYKKGTLTIADILKTQSLIIVLK